MPNKLVDITGQTFGRLTVIARAPENDKSRKALWNCLCACGGTAPGVRGFDLRNGNTVSCGCNNRTAAKKPDDRITYATAHTRVWAEKGSASAHSCVDCAGPAVDWSLRRAAPVTFMGRAGGSWCRFSPSPADYEPRCRKCHRAYDRPQAA